jgi:hypothetical protein
LALLKAEVEREEMGDLLRGLTDLNEQSLMQFQDELSQFVDSDDAKAKHGIEIAANTEDVNPFSALFSIFSGIEGEKNNTSQATGPDSNAEQVLRNQALLKARKECLKIYELYKREHGMPTFVSTNLPI